MDEVGSILPTDWHPDTPYVPGPQIPAAYWQASGALYAYIYLEAAKMGIDVVAESQLVGYESQFPSVSMVDSTTGKPNARMEVLRLLKDNVEPGDRMVKTRFIGTDFDAQVFEGAAEKKMVVVNKRNRVLTLDLPGEFADGMVRGNGLLEGVAVAKGRELMVPAFGVVVVETK
jgi:hypothetical protein